MTNNLIYFGANPIERVENAIKKMKLGKGVLLVDDENRENEGDLIFAAQSMTVEDMTLMINNCSGIVCLCLLPYKCEELNLPQMVVKNESKNRTPFTISIEARNGVSTGVSSLDRITTIKTAINKRAYDLVQPGHIFPLRAKENGVFERRGHTEGSIELVKLAGLGDTAVLCELMNKNGTMARLPEIIHFSLKHSLTVVTIEDIFQYRKSMNTQKENEMNNFSNK